MKSSARNRLPGVVTGVRIEGNRLRLDPFAMRLYDGGFRGTARLDFTAGPRFALTSILESEPVEL